MYQRTGRFQNDRSDLSFSSVSVVSFAEGYFFRNSETVVFHEKLSNSLKVVCANLLYFITKNHSFSDGNKRIAATMFLYFLDKNGLVFKDGCKQIEDNTLVALTIMIAESKPDEKELMVNLVMQFLTN